jgi:hypothetical protein
VDLLRRSGVGDGECCIWGVLHDMIEDIGEDRCVGFLSCFCFCLAPPVGDVDRGYTFLYLWRTGVQSPSVTFTVCSLLTGALRSNKAEDKDDQN